MGQRICPDCWKKLYIIRQPKCQKCSRPLENPRAEYCPDCSKREKYFDRGLALWVYNEAAARSISSFKFHNKREYADFYADELLNAFQKEIRRWNPEVLIPVPIHKKKKRSRGFNQSELIAKKLAGRLGIPVDTGLVSRVKETQPMKELEQSVRSRNITGAFETSSNRLNFKKVMIIDDIYTTGSTVTELARILKQAGVERVYVLCVSIGVSK